MNKKAYLYNSLGKQKQEFKPISEGKVSLYSCGPTVYNIAHVGNLRAYVFADILKRTLEYDGYKVEHVMNVTDIGHLTSDADEGEDKMVKALKREGKPMTLEAMREVANKYFELFRTDLAKLKSEPPDEFPFASDHVPEMVAMIKVLLDKGFAYKTSDGIYFDTAKLPDYGRLSIISDDNVARIRANSEKRGTRDFAVWKFSDSSGIGFDAQFGKGFPGWHIECSAMAEKYLGVPFDIHTGGVDHIPVHHNNEIAQTEAATGKLLANYWLHNEHLTIGEEKMAKSEGNILSLDYLEIQGISPLAYRYWLLTARYSTRMNFSLEAIKAAQTAYERIVSFVSSVPNITTFLYSQEYQNDFFTAINDDLDTPKALAIVWELIRDTKVSDADKKATIIDFDKVLGFGLASAKNVEIDVPPDLQILLNERKSARDLRLWDKADQLRIAINKLGFEVKDTDKGQKLTKL